MAADCDRTAGIRPHWRARFAWVAIVAVLSNALLPLAFAVGIGSVRTDGSSAIRLAFCGALLSRDAPARGKAGLLVHHCALCAASQHVLSPLRQADPFVAPTSVDQAFLSLQEVREPSSSSRYHRAQPRAPPAAV